jgi:hypothetical protein
MQVKRMDQLKAHEQLKQRAAAMQQPGMHLKHLISSPDRLATFSVKGGGLFLDYSRQRIDPERLAMFWWVWLGHSSCITASIKCAAAH